MQRIGKKRKSKILKAQLKRVNKIKFLKIIKMIIRSKLLLLIPLNNRNYNNRIKMEQPLLVKRTKI